MIKAILAEDAEVMRMAISRLLGESSEVELVAEASGYRGLMQLVVEHRPDVVIVDVHMPDVRRVSVLELKSCLDGCPVVAISLSNDKETKALAEAFGACLLLDKRLLFQQLIPAIQQCARQ
jgi:two-component system invasion response regulator UvrY